MEAFALLTAVLYIVTSAVLGAGLLRLSRTRGGAAAGWLAATPLSASVLQSLSIVAAAVNAGDAPSEGAWRIVFVALYAATGVSASRMVRFTQIFYRPKQRLLTAVPIGVALHPRGGASRAISERGAIALADCAFDLSRASRRIPLDGG